MKKGLVYSVLSIIFLLLLISNVSAEILISQPDSKYNLGDNFNVKIEVRRVVETNDFLKVSIVCDSTSVELYKAPLRVQIGKTENISINAKLDRSLIKSTEGSCKINAEYSDESVQSPSFEISDKIDLSVTLSKSTFNPGDQVSLSGKAKKENGEKLNGFLQISLSGTNVSFLVNQQSDSFNYSFRIPENQAANLYGLTVKVYEREASGEIANEGIYSEVIRVNQVITSVDVSINSAFIMPGENLTYGIILKDQSGQEVKTDVNSIIYTPNKEDVFLRQTVKSGDLNSVSIPNNALPGNWEIEGFYNSIATQRSFNVESVSKASFHIEGDELVITNEGNIDYQKTITVFIDDEKINQTTFVSLENPVKRYKIDAPLGAHSVNIMDDLGKDFDLGTVDINESSSHHIFGITAAAIGLSDPDSTNSSYWRLILWVVLILVLLYVAIFYYRKVKKDIFYGKKPQKLSNTQLALKTSPNKKYQTDEGDDFQIKLAEKPVRRFSSESSEEPKPTKSKLLFDTYDSSSDSSSPEEGDYHAKREEVVVLALKIKNGQKLRQSESSALNLVRNVLHRAKVAKAKVYDQGDTNLVVFSQSLSEKASALEAVKVAHDMDLALKDFNKKYAIKIEYGLGMHVGEMFFEMIDGKAKFTSIGNITILPKNLASKANMGLLVSHDLYRKVYTVVKAEQDDSGNYQILSFKDRSSQSQFIQRFMKNSDETPQEPKPSHTHRLSAPAPKPVHKPLHPAKSLDGNPHPPSKRRTFQRY